MNRNHSKAPVRPRMPAGAGQWEVARSVVTSAPQSPASFDLDEAKVRMVAALCLCLRRYRTPDTGTLFVFDRDCGSTRVHGHAINLSFADTLTSEAWLAEIRRCLAEDKVLPDSTTRTTDMEPTGWAKFAVVLQSDLPTLTDESWSSYTRVFAVRCSTHSADLSVGRQTHLAEDWPLEQMLRHWDQLAQGLYKKPPECIGRLAVLTPKEMATLIHAQIQPEEVIEDPRFNFELFDEQAAETPAAPAVTDGDQTIRYRDLAERSNRLAQYLRQGGVGPETLVGVFLERSIDLVVAVIALHKAGGAFLPIDPGYPTRRREGLIADSGVRFIITNDRLAAKLSPGAARIVSLDTEAGAIAAMTAIPPAHGLKPGNIGCVFYTSGSTGEPKGVEIPHLLRSRSDAARRKPEEVVAGEKALLKSAVGFTVVQREIYWALQSGGHLVVVPPGQDRDSAYMVRTIRDEAVVAAHFVPSMLSLIVDEPDLGECHALRLIYTVGESLPVEVQRRLFARLPRIRLFVLYGCTEAPSATLRECRPDESYGDRIVLGRPMPNKRIYLLDGNLMPVPRGVAGEIHTGGSISRGYLNRPELTAERFIPDPFSDHPGDRVYRTGDLARWLPDGGLEFLGRTDFQVQIGGIRIEPGEIEAVIRRHPGIKEAVVVARETGSGAQRLVAYFVTGANGMTTPTALREHVARELPVYMIPTFFVPMAEWPLTTNGKLDRRALPAPEVSAFSNEFVEPRTTNEHRVADIWRRVLGLEQVGAHGNFFELGGHSLAAMRVIARLRNELGIEIPLRTLYAAPTVAQFAEKLEQTYAVFRSPDLTPAGQPDTEEVVI